jgi:AcrR family transcriptional regulator
MQTPASSDAPQHRRSRKGIQRRREIIEAAFHSFSRGGYRSATMADIAAEVGLSEAGLLHHFPSKTDLLLAVLQEREDRGSVVIEDQRRQGRSYIDAFIEVLRANAQAPALIQLFTVLSAESITDGHPAHTWFVERYRSSVRDATQQLNATLDTEHLPDGVTAETVARWLIAMADGMRLQWLLEPEAVDRVEAVEQLVGLLQQVLPARAGDAAGPRS